MTRTRIFGTIIKHSIFKKVIIFLDDSLKCHKIFYRKQINTFFFFKLNPTIFSYNGSQIQTITSRP